MKRFCAALCMFSGLAFAQPYGYPTYGYGRQPYGRQSQEQIFERTQMDLSRAGQHSYDRRRIAKAQHEIGEFQRRLSYGKFSRGDLDRAIGATDDVVRRAGLPPRDRDILYRDLEGMREFRAYAR